MNMKFQKVWKREHEFGSPKFNWFNLAPLYKTLFYYKTNLLVKLGEVVTLPSVDKFVEQFHIITELSAEKGMLGRCNSVIDFRTLECDNPASDSYLENPDLYRRYTLPRNFKPKFFKTARKPVEIGRLCLLLWLLESKRVMIPGSANVKFDLCLGFKLSWHNCIIL